MDRDERCSFWRGRAAATNGTDVELYAWALQRAGESCVAEQAPPVPVPIVRVEPPAPEPVVEPPPAPVPAPEPGPGDGWWCTYGVHHFEHADVCKRTWTQCDDYRDVRRADFDETTECEWQARASCIEWHDALKDEDYVICEPSTALCMELRQSASRDPDVRSLSPCKAQD